MSEAATAATAAVSVQGPLCSRLFVEREGARVNRVVGERDRAVARARVLGRQHARDEGAQIGHWARRAGADEALLQFAARLEERAFPALSRAS